MSEIFIHDQKIPDYLHKKPDETYSTWRDRLYHQYRIPTILSALADLKYPYVEQASPLLSREIINFVRLLNDDMRTDKKLFKQWVDSLGFSIPFATRSANESRNYLINSPEFVKYMRSQLSSETANKIFASDFLSYIRNNLIVNSFKDELFHDVKSRIVGYLPHNYKKSSSENVSHKLNFNLIALRSVIIIESYNLFLKKG